jgi:hypothetical protein
MLEVEHEGGEWSAACEGTLGVGLTAHGAIASALGSQQASIGTEGHTIEAWVSAHAARLEVEAG